MSWVALQPAGLIRPKGGREAVSLSVSKPGKAVQRVYLTVRTQLLPDDGLPWWTNSRNVAVEVGDGDHAGRIRIRDNGPFRTMAPTGRDAKTGNPAPPMLQIPSLPGMPAEGMTRRAVAWEIVGDALVVNLPWGGTTGATKTEPSLPSPARVIPAKSPVIVHQDAVSPVPDLAAWTAGAHHVAALRKLAAAGGRTMPGKLTHAETRALRECEDHGLAAFGGGAWTLTAKGSARLTTSASVGA